jgi:hypothetical protein
MFLRARIERSRPGPFTLNQPFIGQAVILKDVRPNVENCTVDASILLILQLMKKVSVASY